MPTLIKNHEKHVIETQLKKTYSDIQNWIKRSEVDNESSIYWDYSLPYENFVDKYFAPYVKLTRCNDSLVQSNSCFQAGLSIDVGGVRHVDGSFFAITTYPLPPRYLLPDGRAIIISNTVSRNEGWEYLVFAVDVNGARGRSIAGKDVFYFTLFNYDYANYKNKGKLLLGAGPWSGPGEGNKSSELIKRECINGNNHCGVLIQRNGWKIPKDYPIKF